jgi:hypothetical protein
MYLYFSDLREQEGLLHDRDRFTDVLPSRPQLAERQVAALAFDHATISGCARLSRGGKAVSYKWRVSFDEYVPFSDPVPLEELAAELSGRAAAELARIRANRGGQFTPPAADQVIAALSRLRPESSSALARLVNISVPFVPERAGVGEPIVEYERDAVGLALDLARLSRERISALRAWSGDTTEPFLAGITEYAVLEDRMIEHDARVFGGWQLLEDSVVGVVRFSDGHRRATIINVNRAGVEHALGVDLVYYSLDHDAYVVVQYKRMERGSGGDQWSFRPDEQFNAELDRMRSLVPPADAPPTPTEYRLDDHCTYLKICRRATRQPFADSLMPGIYLPLAYWDLLESSGALRGPRGGTVLTHKSAQRWINNTLFIELVQPAWVGSRGETTQQITDLIRSALAAKRSLILARAGGDGEPPPSEPLEPLEPSRLEELRRRIEEG